ncbi:MAG TPA: 16S rRNA (guanine(966)-N(2))-methyltransferase RsmD [Vicinamibacterales bacterium]
MGQLRVIAGSLKGRRLSAPTWDGVRPTSDKLRETLFNVLAPRIAGACVFDGYAGTGAVGIEALSRGAAWATFVDDDRRAEALIARNLAHCGVAGGYAIIRASVEHAFDGVSSSRDSGAFDIVFLDPPYALDDVRVAGVLERAAAVLASEGIVVLEHARKRTPPDAPSLARTRVIPSGDSALTVYRKK